MNKKKLSKILIIIILGVCFIFTGCAEISFTTYHNDDGSITEQVVITIDEQELSSYGYNVLQEEQKIFKDVQTRLKNLVSGYKNYLEILYNSHQLTPDNYKTLYTGVVGKMSAEWVNGSLTAQLDYASQTDYQLFYIYLNGETTETGSQEVVKKTFYVKTIYTGTANYGDFALYNEVYASYANSTFARFDPEATTLYYNYAVSSKRIHSDADNIQLDSNGNYIHRWKIDKDEPSRIIHLYVIQARPSYWILLCIGISLVVCVITAIAFAINKPKKPKQNNEQIEE